jgi:soluble lytic murein transglycosylase-like protein
LACVFSGSAISRPLSYDKYDDDIRSSIKRYWGDFPDWLYWKSQLYQESGFNPDARSQVGALGLAQFMPATWDQVMHQLGMSGISARDAKYAIDAGAFYMANLRRTWSSPRPAMDRHKLAEASYNAGTGNLVKAQKMCGGKALYSDIAPCLPMVTGPSAQETLTYVTRIDQWREQLAAFNR